MDSEESVTARTLRLMRDEWTAPLQAENADLRRQLEDARDLVVRSGYFEFHECPCVFVRHESSICQALTEQEMSDAGIETDHSAGHEPGESCDYCDVHNRGGAA